MGTKTNEESSSKSSKSRKNTEDGDGFGGGETNPFSDKLIRQRFIRKVYSILSVQLVVTFGFTLGICHSEEARKWMMKNNWFFYCALVAYMAIAFAILCFGTLQRQVPYNYIALGMLTVVTSAMVGFLASLTEYKSVMTAVAITAVVTIGLTLFAFQTKIDFTPLNAGLFVVSFCLLLFGLVLLFWHNKIAYLIYSLLGALLCLGYILVHTQMIVGGFKSEFSPEDYVVAVLLLYIDIITLFIHILAILRQT